MEAVGLWWQKRWAEYLTLIATALFLPLEVYEIAHKLSPLKIIALIVNIAVVLYLLFAKRLFGIRGGAAAEHAQRERARQRLGGARARHAVAGAPGAGGAAVVGGSAGTLGPRAALSQRRWPVGRISTSFTSTRCGCVTA